MWNLILNLLTIPNQINAKFSSAINDVIQPITPLADFNPPSIFTRLGLKSALAKGLNC